MWSLDWCGWGQDMAGGQGGKMHQITGVPPRTLSKQVARQQAVYCRDSIRHGRTFKICAEAWLLCILYSYGFGHRVLTYIEYRYRAVSGVVQTIDPPPHSTQRVCPPGRWEVNISEDARHWIGLLQYNPSTVFWLSKKPIKVCSINQSVSFYFVIFLG